MKKDPNKRKITFLNTDVDVTSKRVQKILSDKDKAKELVKKIREQRKEDY